MAHSSVPCLIVSLERLASVVLNHEGNFINNIFVVNGRVFFSKLNSTDPDVCVSL